MKRVVKTLEELKKEFGEKLDVDSNRIRVEGKQNCMTKSMFAYFGNELHGRPTLSGQIGMDGWNFEEWMYKEVTDVTDNSGLSSDYAKAITTIKENLEKFYEVKGKVEKLQEEMIKYNDAITEAESIVKNYLK